MALVATLIANPSNPVLCEELADEAARALGGGIDWLATGLACDVTGIRPAEPAEVERALRGLIGDRPIDVAVHDDADRRKSLLVADMDSTMIGQECIDELAAEVGLKEKVAAITARAMNGEIDFEPALRERVALLAGLRLDVVGRVLETRVTLAPGGRELIATMRANGAHTALVSGGFTVFTGPVAEMLGFHEHRANILVEKDGVLAGMVQEPILGRQAKVDALTALARDLGISLARTIAVGDGANDLGMLNLAGMGVALHAKPAVAAAAGVRIDHGDLTALLYLQGYRKEDFAA